jgi:hypothetical protein
LTNSGREWLIGRVYQTLGSCKPVYIGRVAGGELRTDHNLCLAGQRFLTLHDEIERLAVARACHKE